MECCTFAASTLLLPRHDATRLHLRCRRPSSRPTACATARDRPKPLTARPLPNLGALGALNGVTILWGTQHAVMKLAVDAGVPPASLNLGRFAVASALLSPFLAGASATELAAGLELGLWSFLGFALQTAGLATTTAARSGFLLYLNVKLVPLLGALTGRKVPESAWLAASIALAGTFCLAGDGAPWADGDSLSVLAAAASAAFILRLEARARDARPAQLSAVTVGVTAAFSAGWLACTGGLQGGWLSGAGGGVDWTTAAAAALYLGAIPTAAATVLQAWAQKEVPAERAAIVYALDPVYGALFANLLLGEKFGARGFVGAGLIFVAAFVSNFALGDQTRMKVMADVDIGSVDEDQAPGKVQDGLDTDTVPEEDSGLDDLADDDCDEDGCPIDWGDKEETAPAEDTRPVEAIAHGTTEEIHAKD